VQHLNKIVEDLYQIMGFELMHASQAIDLKKIQTPGLQIGKDTKALYSDYRKVIPFLQKDRELTPDIKMTSRFITQYEMK
jgi:histidine ammonia-lyase